MARHYNKTRRCSLYKVKTVLLLCVYVLNGPPCAANIVVQNCTIYSWLANYACPGANTLWRGRFECQIESKMNVLSGTKATINTERPLVETQVQNHGICSQYENNMRMRNSTAAWFLRNVSSVSVSQSECVFELELSSRLSVNRMRGNTRHPGQRSHSKQYLYIEDCFH